MNTLGNFSTFGSTPGNPSDLEKNQILEAHEKAFEIEVGSGSEPDTREEGVRS